MEAASFSEGAIQSMARAIRGKAALSGNSHPGPKESHAYSTTIDDERVDDKKPDLVSRAICLISLVGRVRLELTTNGLKVQCSTD